MKKIDENQTAEKFITLLKNNDFLNIRKYADELNPTDLADVFVEIGDPKKIIIILRLLKNDHAAEIFTYLNSDLQEELIEIMSNGEVKDLFEEIFTDDLVDILEEMPANIVRKILKSTTPQDRKKINIILKYKDDSAGSIMSVDYIKLSEDQTIEEAIKKIKNYSEYADDVSNCFVVDNYGNLKGIVTFKELIFYDETTKLKEIMDTNFVYCHTNDDQEVVANTIKKYDVNVLPILNSKNKLVGMVTVDDIIDVIEEETIEDVHKLAGVNPLDKEYLKTNSYKIIWKRILWLFVIMIIGTLTQILVTILIDRLDNKNINTQSFTVLIIPLILVVCGLSNNFGTQTFSIVTWGISLKKFSRKNYWRLFFKEMNIAFTSSLILCLLNFARMIIIYLIEYKDINQSFIWNSLIITSIAMFLSIILGDLIAFVIPLVIRGFKKDPANIPAPIIRTIIDLVTIVLFYGIAIPFAVS